MNQALGELKKLHEFYKYGRYSKLGISIALEVDRRTVRRWLQGKTPPSEKHQKMIQKLVEDLKKSIKNPDKT
ncbi:hypothetical protein ACFL5C_03230 [Candidatus Omnitrophota bacterium]